MTDTAPLHTVPLREVAHARSGEKGNNSMVSVIAFNEADYPLLLEQVTEDAVRSVFGPITKGSIRRFEVPAIGALNFVLDEVLEGGRSRTLAFEESGKALSSLMLTLPLRVPSGHARTPTPEAAPRPTLQRTEGRSVRLGSATAWSRDRFEPAADLLDRGNLDYLCFETMSEVTMSAAQASRLEDDATPLYDPYLVARMKPILRQAKAQGVRIITNQGWLDPIGAALRLVELAGELGIENLRIAAVDGGILTDRITDFGVNCLEDGRPVAERRDTIVSAEAYMGAAGIVEALALGADVVVTTRVADACLYLGPLAHEFGWSLEDYERTAQGMIIGHLMECGAQVCGGYFADPGYKDVPRLAEVGNPIAEVSGDRVILSKLPDSGGLLSPATCKEQLLYEVGNPAEYLCPDCVADLTKVSFEQIGLDEVAVHFAPGAGQPKPPTLKVLVGVREGFMTEEMVIFAGPGALTRARATEALLWDRFRRIELRAEEIRFDYLGINAVHREASPPVEHEPYEVILRIGLKTATRIEADKLRREVDPLAVNGLAGTGKWATSSPGSRVRPVVGLNSCLVPRELVPTRVVLAEVLVKASA